MEIVLVPCRLVLVGDLLFIGDGCQRIDVRVHGRWFIHPVTVEHRVVGDVAHLGFLEDEG